MNYKTIIKEVKSKIYKTVIRPTIEVKDANIVTKIKNSFDHGDRELFYGKRLLFADSLYCEATPGLIETVISNLYLLKKKGGNILLNLGGGKTSKMLALAGFDVYNLDIAVKKNEEKNNFFDLNSRKKLPYKSNFFDFVVCQEVIEHIENPWELFRNAYDSLKLGGVLFLTTPNIHSTFSKRKFLKTNDFHWFGPECISYHINALPIWEIELIASKTGFKVRKLQGSGDYYFGGSEGKNRQSILAKNESLIFEFIKCNRPNKK